ncbi:MAG: Crp/Fnr family transcriptional regulator [Solirubrobacteraceae bacterium]|jgi:CRP-like cAMP-binding protein
MQTKDELIAEASVFAGLKPEHLKMISSWARLIDLEPDQYVLREGERAQTFYIIRRGAIAIEVRGAGRAVLAVDTAHDGDIVGLSWLFAPYRLQFDARTTEPCSLVAIEGARLRDMCEDDHEFGYQLMRRFAAVVQQRLERTRTRLLDVYGSARAIR